MLRAAFSPEWLSSSGDDGVKVLTLSDVCADGFERVLEFLYTGTCAVGESTLTATLEAASRLEVLPLLALQPQRVHAVPVRLGKRCVS